MNPTNFDPFNAVSQTLIPKRAISYIRVSTREQTVRTEAAKGFSTPAQRKANKRKVTTLGTLIVKEPVDRGESARSTNRPQLQETPTYIQEIDDIDYCIIHKFDHLARNRADDIDINRVFDQARVRLISTTENTNRTPSGILLHDIMSSVAESYSHNLASEVVKGLAQKAKSGGTISHAPLGYLNRQGHDEQGRGDRQVRVDPERGPLMALAFTEYAAGQWTLSALTDCLIAHSLTILATPSRPSHPLDHNKLLDLLHNPYYRGVITYRGVGYLDKHQTLVDDVTWHQVQTVLSQHRYDERQRIHNHHLKTAVHCGQCDERLTIHKCKSRSEQIYPYFMCSHRRRHRSACSFKAVPVDKADARVTKVYERIYISVQGGRTTERYLTKELHRIYAHQHDHAKDLHDRQTKLQAEQTKLLHAHYTDAVPLDLLKAEQAGIARQLVIVDRDLHSLTADRDKMKGHLSQALDLLEDCHHLYTHIPDNLKKLLSMVFFDHIDTHPTDDEVSEPRRSATPHPAAPFDQFTSPELLASTNMAAIRQTKTPSAYAEGAAQDDLFDTGLCKSLMMELRKFKPLTFSL